MYLTAEIQARDPKRAELAAAFEAFRASGKTIITLPGPGEARSTGADYRGAPQRLPLGEQTQHIHRQRAQDKANWEIRQAMIEANGEQVREEASKGACVPSIAMTLKLTRAEVRTIGSALGIAFSSSKRKKVTGMTATTHGGRR
ncbi:hypothetical protein KRX52_04235 [Pseudomonas sp. MAP12]|uniref:Uncharacterized protein n=1 Tax=Geopseudomonas aromaticivorans TaxID=2849492 RepID=A0ABS6MT79_9GAMM|nr:hypothetical protein [Pseudomonas aromaticivorans]MBV2132006.1 hypothetical protein [Pseudomonas aromaticivorans]